MFHANEKGMEQMEHGLPFYAFIISNYSLLHIFQTYI